MTKLSHARATAPRPDLLPGVGLPLDAVTRRLAVIATSGAGKTYAAMKLAELMLADGHQIIALDVAGPWWGLRVGADGTSPGFSVAVIGGPHADVPLAPGAGALVADTLVDTRVSAVIDLSEFSDSEIARFGSAFAERFFQRKKSAPTPVHLFLEEAHELMPQNPEREQNIMLNRWKKLTRQGRNYGIGWTLVSQSPQSLNKRCLNLAECVITLRLYGAHERKAVTDWVANVSPDPKKASAKINSESPYLDDGFAFVWSPAWLKIMGGDAARIEPKLTFDSSKTPEPGDVVVETLPTPKALDLPALEVAMKEIVDAAKADDPEALRAEIKRLNAQIQRINDEYAHMTVAALPPPAPEPKIVEIPTLKNDEIKRLESALDRLASIKDELGREIGKAISDTLDALIDTRAALNASVMFKPPAARADAAPQSPLLEVPASKFMHAPPVATAQRLRRPPDTTKVSGPQLRMLNALAAFEVLGLRVVTRGNLAVYSNQSPRSSGFEKNLSTLHAMALIRYPSSGHVELTDAGRTLAPVNGAPAKLGDLHAAWIGKVSGPQARMLGVLIGIYPNAINREQLADRSNQSVTSSGFEKNLSTLRTLGLIDYPDRGRVAATSMLFPAGLR